MKKFDVIKLVNCYLVIPIKNHRMDEIFPDVEKFMGLNNFSGKVFFDLLLINGDASNRIISVDSNDKKLNLRSIEAVKISSLNKEIIDSLSTYHWKHKSQIIGSVLPSMQKSRILSELERTQLVSA